MDGGGGATFLSAMKCYGKVHLLDFLHGIVMQIFLMVIHREPSLVKIVECH